MVISLITLVFVVVIVGWFGRKTMSEATELLTAEEKAALAEVRRMTPLSVFLTISAISLPFVVLLIWKAFAPFVALLVAVVIASLVWDLHKLRKAPIPKAYVEKYLTALGSAAVGAGYAIAVPILLAI